MPLHCRIHAFLLILRNRLNLYFGDPVSFWFCVQEYVVALFSFFFSFFKAIVQLWNALFNVGAHDKLPNLKVLNYHARNLNNWTSSLTSTTISFLSSHDSKLKVSSLIRCSYFSHIYDPSIIYPTWTFLCITLAPISGRPEVNSVCVCERWVQ